MSDTGQVRHEWIDRIKRVEWEFDLVDWSLDYLESVLRHDPTTLPRRFDPRKYAPAFRQDIRRNLEGTYLLRAFAEFETGLRLYWEATRKKAVPSSTKGLLDGIASRQKIPSDRIDAAHAVREYRNSLIHEREDDVEPVSLSDAIADLCQFFKYLPPRW